LFYSSIDPLPSAVAHHVLGRYEHPPASTPNCEVAALTACAGFKKNVNRATTQVMMKTGTHLLYSAPWALWLTDDRGNRPCREDQRPGLRSRGEVCEKPATNAPMVAQSAMLHRVLLDTADLTVYRRFRTMEAASLRLQKEAKGYLDSLRGEQSCYCMQGKTVR
jgi:hypothetical protein